jgi:hypothetical protein
MDRKKFKRSPDKWDRSADRSKVKNVEKSWKREFTVVDLPEHPWHYAEAEVLYMSDYDDNVS